MPSGATPRIQLQYVLTSVFHNEATAASEAMPLTVTSPTLGECRRYTVTLRQGNVGFVCGEPYTEHSGLAVPHAGFGRFHTSTISCFVRITVSTLPSLANSDAPSTRLRNRRSKPPNGRRLAVLTAVTAGSLLLPAFQEAAHASPLNLGSKSKPSAHQDKKHRANKNSKEPLAGENQSGSAALHSANGSSPPGKVAKVSWWQSHRVKNGWADLGPDQAFGLAQTAEEGQPIFVQFPDSSQYVVLTRTGQRIEVTGSSGSRKLEGPTIGEQWQGLVREWRVPSVVKTTKDFTTLNGNFYSFQPGTVDVAKVLLWGNHQSVVTLGPGRGGATNDYFIFSKQASGRVLVYAPDGRMLWIQNPKNETEWNQVKETFRTLGLTNPDRYVSLGTTALADRFYLRRPVTPGTALNTASVLALARDSIYLYRPEAQNAAVRVEAYNGKLVLATPAGGRWAEVLEAPEHDPSRWKPLRDKIAAVVGETPHMKFLEGDEPHEPNFVGGMPWGAI